MKSSEKFELQIKRIHALLEQKGSEVIWNDKIPDPDNPAQQRQIDITIKRDDKITFIECRIHHDKQDVQWIEELIGRRVSLKADALIAVSASGFTAGAIAKARNFGIILRDILSLTEEEISSWGHLTRVGLNFNRFVDTFLGFRIDKNNDLTIDDLRLFLQTNGNLVFNIFNLISNKFEEINSKVTSAAIKGKLEMLKEVSIKNYPIKEVIFKTKISSLRQELSIPSVVAYDDPNVPLENRSIFIENVALGNFEITKSSNNVSIAVDLSQVESPPGCLFRFVDFDFGKTITIKHVEFFGKPDLGIRVTKLNVALLN